MPYYPPASASGGVGGSGSTSRIPQWSASTTLGDANLIGPASNVLTLEATGAYTLIVPATGTAALLGAANAFTAGPNRFTSGADATTALAVRRNSSTDSANIFQVENESGADAAHVFTNSTVTELASRHPTSGKAFKLRATSTATSNWNFETSNGGFFIFGDLNSVTPLQLFDNGKVSVNGNFVAPVGQLHVEANDTSTTTVLTALSLTHRSTGVAAAGFGIKQEYTLKSSTTARRAAGEWVVTWADATDASRTARVVGNVYDTAVREWIRGEASGSAAMIGFLGVNAAARQTGGAQTAGAAYGATEQDMLQKAYDALRTFGLLT